MKDVHKLRVDGLFKPSKHHSNIKSKFYSMSKCPNMFYTENNVVRYDDVQVVLLKWNININSRYNQTWFSFCRGSICMV